MTEPLHPRMFGPTLRHTLSELLDLAKKPLEEPAPPRTELILAVARNRGQFQIYCKTVGISPQRLRYCATSQSLQGYDRNTPLLLIEGWLDNAQLDLEVIHRRFPSAEHVYFPAPTPEAVEAQRRREGKSTTVEEWREKAHRRFIELYGSLK